jgi:dethiobiotin synthetase
MKSWNIPAIIVSRLGLGTINHTLLTNAFLRSMEISVLGVVLNDTEEVKNIASETNPDALREYLDVPLFGVFPYIKGVLEGTINRELIAEDFARHINTEAIMCAIGLNT